MFYKKTKLCNLDKIVEEHEEEYEDESEPVSNDYEQNITVQNHEIRPPPPKAKINHLDPNIVVPNGTGDDGKKVLRKPKEIVENSDIYKSLKEARERKLRGEKVPNPTVPTKDSLLDISHIDDKGDGSNNLDPIPDMTLPDKESIDIIVRTLKKNAAKLCQVEAREAFATYLTRVKARFKIESTQRRIDNRTGN
jgi:hypothetical protein